MKRVRRTVVEPWYVNRSMYVEAVRDSLFIHGVSCGFVECVAGCLVVCTRASWVWCGSQQGLIEVI